MDDEWSPFKQWSLTAIRDWAGATFPNAFAGLPSVDEIVFVKLDEEMMEISPFRLPTNALKKLMCIGLWDGIPCDPPDRVYAFLHGSHYSQVGYIREESHLTPRRYRRVFPADMKKVDVEEPLCFIAHGSERATLTRLGTLVSYYFVAAGHVSQFSAEESFVEKFEEACLYIEHGWPVIEDPHPESDRLPSDLQNQSAEVASDDNLPEAGSVFAKLEDLGGFRSDDTMCMGTSSCGYLRLYPPIKTHFLIIHQPSPAPQYAPAPEPDHKQLSGTYSAINRASMICCQTSTLHVVHSKMATRGSNSA
ncbi:hypothetical protein PSPO01_14125 [Paraphaeosphaeria sporulosa]